MRQLLLVLVAAGASAAAQSAPPAGSIWQMQNSGTDASLRGIHAVNDRVAWAGGSRGTILRTVDGGTTWTKCEVPDDAEKLDFRSVWAWSADKALVVSAGAGYLSRIYKTTDGCKHWTLTAYSPDKTGFWDGVTFLSSDIGFVLGDPVGNRWDMRNTINGGDDWDADGAPGLDADPKTEGAFAASNSALVSSGPSLWFGSGGKAGAFVHYSLQDCANSQCTIEWHKSPVPVASGTASSGVFSVGVRDVRELHKFYVVAVGGDYEKPNESTRSAAFSLDGGKTWAVSEVPPHGYRSAVQWSPSLHLWVTVGTNGSDSSQDNGKTWSWRGSDSWNALSLPWAVGPNGAIGKLAPGALK